MDKKTRCISFVFSRIMAQAYDRVHRVRSLGRYPFAYDHSYELGDEELACATSLAC